MAIRPDYITIGDLFGRNYIFRVPRYQRGYAWEDAETDDFIHDIDVCYNARVDNGEREHFFGGIVAVKREVTGSAGHHCDLIDGQQRIATCVLLAACLVKHFDHIAATASHQDKELARSRSTGLRAQYLEFRDEINREPVTVPRLVLSDPDQPFFKSLLDHATCPPCPTNPERESHARLWRAYSRLYHDLEDAISDCTSVRDKMEVLARVREVLLKDATVINIVTDEEAEAYRLFQVLNNRGTKLTEGDLLRASTLEMLGIASLATEHETAADTWDDILRYEPSYTQNFLGWYFASTQGRRPGQSSLFDEFFAAIFPQHESATLSKSQAREVVRAIQAIQAANLQCRQLLDGDWPYDPITAKRWDIDRLQLLVGYLDHTACLPLLIAATKLDEPKFVEIVGLTERFAFRYKSICNLHIGSLQNVYHEHATAIRRGPTQYRVASLRASYRALQDDKATDALFAASLAEKLSYQQSSGNKLVKYFVSTLEHFWRWYEGGAQGSPKCRDKGRVFDLAAMSVEHIYPKNPRPADRQQSLDAVAHKLGNLTLLGESDNDASGNKPFEAKKAFLAASPLRLNQLIAEKTTWRKADITQRERELIDAATQIFSM